MVIRPWLNVVLAAAFTVFVGVCPAGAAGLGALKIAFVGDMTGAKAGRAVDQVDGFRLGIKDLGGRVGGIELSFQAFDDHLDPELARQIVTRLEQMGRIDFLLVSGAGRQAAAVAPVAAAANTFVINLGSAPPAQAGGECDAAVFSLVGLAETRHLVAGQYLQGQGLQALAVAGPETPAAHSAIAALRQGFKGKVVEILSPLGTMSFQPAMKQIAEAHVDGLYLLHTGGMAVEFASQLAELKTRPPLFGPDTTFDQSFLAAAAPASLGAVSIGPWSEDLDNPANRRLMSEFENEYGRPPSYQAAVGYDAALTFDAVIKAAQAADKKIAPLDAVRMALRRLELPGSRGIMRFDTNQFPILTYLVRQVVNDSRGRPVNAQKGVFLKDVRDGHAGECPLR
jgi:branched-chain amino acid transport system substrate-binding protein